MTTEATLVNFCFHSVLI